MLENSITHYRSLASGAAILGFVAALEVEDLIDPTNVGSTHHRLQQVAEHPTRFVAAAALLFISSALLIPTIATLRNLVRQRVKGQGLMTGAAAVWTIGALGHATVVGYYAVLAAAAKHQTPQVLAVLNRTTGTDTGLGPILGISIACFALGCLLTIAALVRSSILSRWLLLAIVGGIAGQPLGKAIGIRAFDLGQLAAVTPLIWVGRHLTTAPIRTRPQTRPRLTPALET